jgi:hypothetical protein
MFFVLCAPLTKKADKQTGPSLAWDIKQDNPILIFFFIIIVHVLIMK